MPGRTKLYNPSPLLGDYKKRARGAEFISAAWLRASGIKAPPDIHDLLKKFSNPYKEVIEKSEALLTDLGRATG